MPAHPVKNASKNNLTPKGGSSLLNEVDGNLTLWNDDGQVTLHWQGKHRGADFDALKIELKVVQNEKIKDRKGRIMPSVVAVSIDAQRAAELAVATLSKEDAVLLSLHKEPRLSLAERCLAIGMVSAGGSAQKSTLLKVMARLAEQKLVRQFRRSWELTSTGEKAVEMIRSHGKTKPDEL